jgi:hypothetical protein
MLVKLTSGLGVIFHLLIPDCVGCEHELVVVDPNNGGGFRGLPVLVQLGVQLPEGVDGRVGEHLVDFGVRLESGVDFINII